MVPLARSPQPLALLECFWRCSSYGSGKVSFTQIAFLFNRPRPLDLGWQLQERSADGLVARERPASDRFCFDKCLLQSAVGKSSVGSLGV